MTFGELVGGVNAVAFDREGRRLALAGLERIEIWDRRNARLVMPLTGHTKWVYCVAFQPDGKRLASGGWDNTIKLWDLATGARSGRSRATGDSSRSSPSALTVNSSPRSSEDRSVRLWDPATGRELAAFHGHAHFVHALAFHPDGRRILSGSLDGTVKVWDAVTSRPIVFRGHSGSVYSVEFREDGRHLVSKAGYDRGAIHRRRKSGTSTRGGGPDLPSPVSETVRGIPTEAEAPVPSTKPAQPRRLAPGRSQGS